MNKETEELFKLASDALLEKYDLNRTIGRINYFDSNLNKTREGQKIEKIIKEISEGFECESTRGIYKSNGVAMFLALSLGKENLEMLIQEPDSYSKIAKIKEMQPLKGKKVLEIGGKRLSPTAYGMGADKAIGFDAGQETSDGGMHESFSLETYLQLHPEKADITFSQWALESGFGYISRARFSREDSTMDIDALADVLASLSNTTKEGGFSIHTYSSPDLMKKFAVGPLKDYLHFIGFKTIHYEEKEKNYGDNCVVYKKITNEETNNWSFLISREEENHINHKASLLKKEDGEIVEEKLDLSIDEAIKQYTNVDKMQGIVLSINDITYLDQLKDQSQREFFEDKINSYGLITAVKQKQIGSNEFDDNFYYLVKNNTSNFKIIEMLSKGLWSIQGSYSKENALPQKYKPLVEKVYEEEVEKLKSNEYKSITIHLNDAAVMLNKIGQLTEIAREITQKGHEISFCSNHNYWEKAVKE